MSGPEQARPRHGLPNPPPYCSPPKLTPAQRDEIRRRREAGESTVVLAAEFGVTARTIRRNS